MGNQSIAEYKAELEAELRRLKTSNSLNPSEYKERRIKILQDRLAGGGNK
jgi:hypothetical protein